jgi:hypothetical protein
MQSLSETYMVITNDVSDYINLLVRIAHIICNHSLYSNVLQLSTFIGNGA